MRLATILLFLVLISCTKNNDSITTSTSVLSSNTAAAIRKPEACSFGITHFNRTRRTAVQETILQKVKITAGPQITAAPSATIYLDFDGQDIANTLWNSNGAFTCAPANLYATEIQKIMVRVSEDYSPFNVTVTTDEAVYLATNANRRMRVVITDSWEWYGTVGGIAHYGSFTWGDNTPCFVFSSLMGYNEKYIAEAISHEVGHTLGLQHQASFSSSCAFLSEYNTGSGDGEIGWAPIMGISYYKNVTTWNRGAVVSGCGTVQDDVNMLANVIGLRPDENSTMTKSIELTTTREGEINSSTDIDYYFVDVKTAAVLKADPNCLGNGTGANLHMKLNIYDKRGELLFSQSNPSALSATAGLQPGKYYIGVETAESTNFGRYGQLGRYLISIN
jgi:hypothetical protein